VAGCQVDLSSQLKEGYARTGPAVGASQLDHRTRAIGEVSIRTEMHTFKQVLRPLGGSRQLYTQLCPAAAASPGPRVLDCPILCDCDAELPVSRLTPAANFGNDPPNSWFSPDLPPALFATSTLSPECNDQQLARGCVQHWSHLHFLETSTNLH
jgi:hypothetical protein